MRCGRKLAADEVMFNFPTCLIETKQKFQFFFFARRRRVRSSSPLLTSPMSIGPPQGNSTSRRRRRELAPETLGPDAKDGHTSLFYHPPMPHPACYIRPILPMPACCASAQTNTTPRRP